MLYPAVKLESLNPRLWKADLTPRIPAPSTSKAGAFLERLLQALMQEGILMPRPSKADSTQAIIENSARELARRVSQFVSNAIAHRVVEELEQQLAVLPTVRRSQRRTNSGPLPRRNEEITRWIPDRRARRVPTFVIEMTGGLDTKKKIVAKYGADVVFEKGKPLPKSAKAA